MKCGNSRTRCRRGGLAARYPRPDLSYSSGGTRCGAESLEQLVDPFDTIQILVAMRQQSIHTRHDPQRRRFRSLRGFVAGAEGYAPDSLDPLRIVALLERSGGRASTRMLAANLHLSPRAVDDAVRKLESEGVVSASRMPQADDVTIRLYQPRTRTSE